jgi:type IV pilus assembly protein PilC
VAKFKYEAVTAEGTAVSGVEDALTRTQARIALTRRELDVVNLEEKKSVLSFELTKKKVPRKDLMHFSRQLAVFIRAGIPIIEGLEVIAEDTGNKVFKLALVEMAEGLRAGMTFADAAEAQPHAFPNFYLGILRSAEMTGNLDEVLEQLAEYIERDVEARQKVIGALIYPAVVAGASIVAVIILVAYVLPKFKTFFDDLDAKLPLPTRMLISTTDFLTTWWWALLAGMAAITVAVMLALRTEAGKLTRDKMMLGAPVLGDMMRHAILERFCRILASMVAAGVPLPDALVVTADATNNRVYRIGLAAAREEMLQGGGLAEPLASSGLFPPAARQMFRVGESTGTLDKQMQTAATYFDRELDFRIKRFTGLFEPAVILGVGLVVGFVAIALVSAMYGIFHQVKV